MPYRTNDVSIFIISVSITESRECKHLFIDLMHWLFVILTFSLSSISGKIKNSAKIIVLVSKCTYIYIYNHMKTYPGDSKCGFTLAWTFTSLSGDQCEWLVPSALALKLSWQDDQCSHVCQHQGHRAWKHPPPPKHTHTQHCITLWSVIKYSMKKDTNASGKVMSSTYKVRTQLHTQPFSVCL